MELRDLYAPIGKELALVEVLIKHTIGEVIDPNLKRINSLLLQSKGKRLRVAFVILSAYAGNEKTSRKNVNALIKTAAAFELIHMATLVHDDVMDKNEVRHGKPTINKQYGNASAIGVGDFLFASAFNLISQTSNIALMGIASKAIADVCEGQIYQLSRRGSKNLTLKEGYLIIEKKTAALFAAACEAGSVIAGCSKDGREKAKEFGRHFGIAFQLVDDYADIMGSEKMLGKKPGENLHEGEATIPILMLIKKASPIDRKGIVGAMFSKKCLGIVKNAFILYGIHEDVNMAVKDELKNAAKNAISTVGKDNRYSLSLLGIFSLLEKRIATI